MNIHNGDILAINSDIQKQSNLQSDLNNKVEFLLGETQSVKDKLA